MAECILLVSYGRMHPFGELWQSSPLGVLWQSASLGEWVMAELQIWQHTDLDQTGQRISMSCGNGRQHTLWWVMADSTCSYHARAVSGVFRACTMLNQLSESVLSCLANVSFSLAVLTNNWTRQHALVDERTLGWFYTTRWVNACGHALWVNTCGHTLWVNACGHALWLHTSRVAPCRLT